MLARIEAVDAKVNAFITVTAEEALERCGGRGQEDCRGEMTELTGIPVALKGYLSHQRSPNHLRLTHPGKLRPSL